MCYEMEKGVRQMFNNPSLITRIAYGKLTGLVFAGVGLLIIPQVFPELTTTIKLGFVLYYITLGALIGLFGVLTYHPTVNMQMRWWFRGPAIGAWMNFILVLFIYDQMAPMMVRTFGAGSVLASPWWIILEGALFGLIADFICTRFAGEGVACVTNTELKHSVE
jgi:hypothetical protein